MVEQARKINEKEFYDIISQKEGDFLDFKCKLISGVKLQESVVSLANSDGGELYIGIKDENEAVGERRFDGFDNIEEANNLLRNSFNLIIPTLIDLEHEFIEYKNKFILLLNIFSKDTVYKTSAKKVFVRKGAQNIEYKTEEEIRNLEYSKGSRKREDETLNIDLDVVSDSEYLKEYCKRVPVLQDKDLFLKKETLLYQNKPRIAGVIGLSDLPQSCLKCGIKITRLQFNTTEKQKEYKRAYLDEDNSFSMEGPAEILIVESVKKVKEIMEKMTFKQYGKEDTKLKYPDVAILELIANAVIHRDYAVEDEIHVNIYDNQIDIISPGKFPAGITPKNIKTSRYSRNPRVVRILHKLPNRINRDLGEGIDTVYNVMKEAKLTPPIFSEKDDYVVATLKHTPIASYENQIVAYLKDNRFIANKDARKITGEEDKVKIKNVFSKLIKHKKIKVANPEESKDKRKYELF